jgi:Spy/CpxP family protein refolding chaperone
MTPQGSSLEQAPKERFEAYMALENQRAKVRFERDERSVRAVSQLKRILTPEQVARIPALAGYMDRLQDGGGAMGAFE